MEHALAQASIGDERLRRLLTITGVNTIVAIGLLSAIGAVELFPNPDKLVSYFGLNPSVYQSGPTPAKHVHITKWGRSCPRGLLVEAALGRCTGTRPSARFLPALTRSPRPANRHCRDGTQTGGHRVARCSRAMSRSHGIVQP